MSTGNSIGIDIGGTHVLAVVCDRCGDILFSSNSAFMPDMRSDKDRVIGLLVKSVEVMIVKASSSITDKDEFELLGVGVGVPGNVDPIKGTTRYLPNFGWLDEVPLSRILKDALNRSDVCREYNCGTNLLKNLETKNIQMRNDGRCAALAERSFGYGKGLSSEECPVFCMLTLGTGIGGALICSKQDGSGGNILFDGCTYDAGDFGHHVMCSGEEAFPCVCGKRGCFEQHASAAGLARHYNSLLEAAYIHLSNDSAHYDQSAVAEFASSTTGSLHKITRKMAASCIVLGYTPEGGRFKKAPLTREEIEVYMQSLSPISLDNAKVVVDLVKDDDPVATLSWLAYLEDLSTGLANLISFYNPSVIVLGGGLGKSKELYAEWMGLTLQQRVDAKTLPATRKVCSIVASTMGGTAGAIGAANLVHAYA